MYGWLKGVFYQYGFLGGYTGGGIVRYYETKGVYFVGGVFIFLRGGGG